MTSTKQLQIQVKNKINGTQYIIYAHYIALATGIAYIHNTISGIDNIYDKDNRIIIDSTNYTTRISNIYAGGSAIQKKLPNY